MRSPQQVINGSNQDGKQAISNSAAICNRLLQRGSCAAIAYHRAND
ncbi:hypothetical protein COO91_05679 [Nostoc flagelliforme CCNUN1]|uniref:Uncharacterized protein n=1 Tax=Nostoc flagelliforme CCNUN1 TaxID=2038116 RepID=A0A2K8SW41_9NOSO|nr:hypothetical protein [Nostoc flagelliforme]AUB39681.1 hypothetical protein COO91_05679 [Nostoc flagelliforme CCNUN1]